jgi:hypothetical protein
VARSEVNTTLTPAARRGLAVEAAVAAAIVMTLGLVLDPRAPGAGSFHPHLLWIAVLVIAAQYGVRGLIASLTACIGALALGSIFVGESLHWLVARASDGSELVAFAGAIAVAWVSNGHARRKAALAQINDDTAARADEAETSFNDLRTVADGLVRQIDRAQLSISYLRSLAERIDGADPLVSADAAIELAMSRIGARVGAVLIHDGTRLRVLAHRGTWSANSAVPPDVFQDRTADQAFAQRRPLTALELGTVNELDSDIAAPIPGKDGKVAGVFVIRGLNFDLELASMEQYQAALADLSAVARWISRSVDSHTATPAAAIRPSYQTLIPHRLPANTGAKDVA